VKISISIFLKENKDLSLTLLKIVMSIIPGTYLPEIFNIKAAAVIGLIIVVLAVAIAIGGSKSRGIRRKPE